MVFGTYKVRKKKFPKITVDMLKIEKYFYFLNFCQFKLEKITFKKFFTSQMNEGSEIK